MKTPLIIAIGCLLAASGAVAQERTAGQAMDAQVNWSALKNSIDLVSNQNKAMAAVLDKMQACNAKEKLFIGVGKAGADSDGCKSPSPILKVVTDASKETSIVSPQNTGWVYKNCPDGTVMTGGYWTHSDTWAMHCRPLITQ